MSYTSKSTTNRSKEAVISLISCPGEVITPELLHQILTTLVLDEYWKTGVSSAEPGLKSSGHGAHNTCRKAEVADDTQPGKEKSRSSNCCVQSLEEELERMQEPDFFLERPVKGEGATDVLPHICIILYKVYKSTSINLALRKARHAVSGTVKAERHKVLCNLIQLQG